MSRGQPPANPHARSPSHTFSGSALPNFCFCLWFLFFGAASNLTSSHGIISGPTVWARGPPRAPDGPGRPCTVDDSHTPSPLSTNSAYVYHVPSRDPRSCSGGRLGVRSGLQVREPRHCASVHGACRSSPPARIDAAATTCGRVIVRWRDVTRWLTGGALLLRPTSEDHTITSTTLLTPPTPPHICCMRLNVDRAAFPTTLSGRWRARPP